jgi:hypothetical protein
MKFTLSFLGIAAITMLASVETTPAQIYPYAYPWCASMGSGGGRDGDSGGENCGFKTYAQCMETAKPFGTCRTNPLYRPDAAETPTPSRRKPRSM